jgi:RHS repeat-associated protein
MKVLKHFFFLVAFSLVTTAAWAYETDCGNDGQDYGTCEQDVGSNPINPYRACIHREVTDLSTFGNASISFKRHFISRYRVFTQSKWEFGVANVWQHNWNFELRESSLTSFGFKNLILRYPEGREYIFSAVDQSGAVRVPSADWGDRLYVSQNTFTLITPQGEEYQFQKLAANSYRLQQVRSGQSYYWNLEYDGANRLIKIKNNFNRWIGIDRETVNGVIRIKRVYSNDGREVTYSYNTWEQTGEAILTTVNYPEGEKAVYDYVGRLSEKEGNPILASAHDPAYRGNGAKIKYTYNYQANYEPYGFVSGSVLEERNLETDQVIVQLPLGSGIYPQILEGNGNEVTRKFDKGQLKEGWDAEGRKKIFTRSAGGYGYIATTTQPNGGVTGFQRDYAGRVLTKTNPLGSQESFDYYPKGFLKWEKDELGRVTTYQRDANNLLLKKIYPNQSYKEWTYNADGQPLTYRQRNGSVHTYTYYGDNEIGGMKGDLKTKTNPYGNVTTYTYDAAGNTKTITDALNRVTSYTYNWRGQVKTITYADNSQVSYSYDNFGKLKTQTDELGHVTSYTYDEYNRVKTITDPLGRTTAYEYGLEPGCGSCADKDTITKITLPSGKRTEFTYDKSGLRLSQIVGAQSEKEQAITFYSYDDGKNLKTVTDPNGHVTTFNYDILHRRTNEIDALGNITSWTFDTVGNRLSKKLADNSLTTYFYDEMDRLTNMIDANGASTKMIYDLSDNLKELVDAKNHTYTYFYDKLNRREGLEYPNSSVEYWNYNKVGNLESYITREGYSCTYLYDDRNRLKQSTWDDGKTPKITRDYDLAGRLKTLVTHYPSPVTLTYDYDAANQLLSEKTEISGQLSAFSVQYSYDADGNREHLIYPDNQEVLTYHYNGRNLLNELQAKSLGLKASYDYDKAGNRLLLLNHFNEAISTYTPDNLNRLTKIEHNSEENFIGRFDYGYNQVHQRQWVKRNQQKGDYYQYDKIGQVTDIGYNTPDVNNPNLSETIESLGYDAVGNRWARVTAGNQNSQTTYQVNSLNQYTLANNPQASTFSYDGNGNLTKAVSNQVSVFSYTYDSQNRLTSANSANSAVKCFYDARNRVVKREINGVATYYVWDNWNLLEERDANGDLIYRYIHGPRIDELISRTDIDGTLFYHHDALGNVTHLSNQKGQLIEKYEYDVFGQPTIFGANSLKLNASAFDNRFLFTGREYLQELGLYDYRNRIYSPSLGRFLQTDPIRFDAGDVNIYRYVENNPINESDPEGLAPLTPGSADTNNWDEFTNPAELLGYTDEELRKENADQKKMIEAHSDAMKDMMAASVPAKSIPEKIAKWFLKEIWKKTDPGENAKDKKDKQDKKDNKDLLKDKEKDSDGDGIPDDEDSDDEDSGDRDGDGIPDNEDPEPDNPNCVR